MLTTLIFISILYIPVHIFNKLADKSAKEEAERLALDKENNHAI